MSTERNLLLAAAAVPFLYFGTVFGAALLVPGYSHATQYASELGMAGEASARFFNTGILATALATILGSFGIGRSLRRRGARPIWTLLGTLMLGLFGIALSMGSIFPMPDPRHGSFGLGMAVHLAPVVLAVAVWPLRKCRRMAFFLLATAVAAGLMFAIMMGVGELVTRANVGLFQRAYALTVFPWVGLLGGSLLTGDRDPAA